MVSFGVVIPTLNAEGCADRLFSSIINQTVQPECVLVIDSSSSDRTRHIAKRYGFRVKQIARHDFNHGKTRQEAAEELDFCDVIMYVTQDAILADSESLQKLLAVFQNERVGAAYGRQLPHEAAGLLGAHARIFNYGVESNIKSLADSSRYGLKTPFISNSFAAYRRSDLLAFGGFPAHTILSEDMYAAAKLLLAGKLIAYVAEATVYHSHDYTLWQEFQRYFDIGVFHANEAWIRETFGAAEGEGMRFVRSEFAYLCDKKAVHLIPEAFIRTGLKFLGYRLGMLEKRIPLKWKSSLSMHKGFWS